MALPEHEKTKVDRFFDEIAPLLSAYRYQKIRYLTVRTNLGFQALQMIVGLSARPLAPRPGSYKTEHVFCEECCLADIGFTPRELIDAITTGPVNINGRSLNLPAEGHTGNHSALHVAFDGAREYPVDRVGRLVVMGDNTMFQHAQDEFYRRELRAQSLSYDSMPALATAFSLDIHGVMAFCLEIHASRVAEVIRKRADDTGQATIEIWLAGGLTTEQLGISLRAPLGSDPRPIPLGRPAHVAWSRDEDGDWVGKVSVATINPESSITCILSYAGLIQHEKTLEPSKVKPNMLRAALDVFDPDCKALRAVIANRELQDRDAQKLEQTVAAILAMRGFRVATVDRVPAMQEVPDILAVDGNGNILVVECTLNMPEAEKKLSKLLKRRDAVRRAFDERGLDQTNVVGVIAVAQSAETLRPFQNDADKHRMIMWSSGDLAQLEADTRPPNSTEIFNALLKAVAALAARLNDDLAG